MRHKSVVVALSLAGLVATALPIMSAGTAGADYAPQAGDVVGVGGDTAQYAVQFAADGDVSGSPGFNGSGDKNRLVALSATADANGRQSYTNSVTTGAASTLLNPTEVLRAGTNPTQRSGDGAISALLADQNSPEVINYVYSSSLPTEAQQVQAGDQGWGYLHVVQIGTDSVQMRGRRRRDQRTGGAVDQRAPRHLHRRLHQVEPATRQLGRLEQHDPRRDSAYRVLRSTRRSSTT